MIIQSTRISRTGGYKYIEKHLLDKVQENERVQILVGDRAVFADAQALADSKKSKYAMRHLSINPDATMSPSQLAKFIRSIDVEFGIGDQRPRLLVLHQKGGRVHFHLAVSEVDPGTGRILDSRCDYSRLEQLSREYEIANGERVQMSRIDRALENTEGFSAIARQKAERAIAVFDRTQLKLACAKGASELEVEMQRQGLEITDGEKGFILVTSAGELVAAAHRAAGLRKNEFKALWETYRYEITRPHTDGHAARHSSHSSDRHRDCRRKAGRNRQAKFSFVGHHETPNTTDRNIAQPLRARRADYSPLVYRRVQKALLKQNIETIDWDELLRWAEVLAAALMNIVIAPRQLLSARIHHARNGTPSNVGIHKSIGPTLRLGK